jgi:hypothetical protein
MRWDLNLQEVLYLLPVVLDWPVVVLLVSQVLVLMVSAAASRSRAAATMRLVSVVT